MKLYPLSTGFFKLDGGAMHGVVPKSMWNKVNPSDDNNMCTWAMRCLLIEEGNKLIVVDTGMGNKQDEKFFSHFYPHGEDTLEKSIQAHGFNLNDVTDVFLTHLHFDHCGGAIVREGDTLKPAFPNATYWSSAAHWQTATQPNIREKASFLKENILPIQESGQLKMYNEQSKNYFDGILDVYTMYGHTEAMMLPLIHYPAHKVLYCADLIPSAAHISLPWVMSYDMQPLHTLDEKARLLNEAVDNGWALFLEHDPKIEQVFLERTEKGIKAVR
jgi:glyoxylase-like metal-dependent hydrolase (beta-lactamase superfamily II)